MIKCNFGFNSLHYIYLGVYGSMSNPTLSHFSANEIGANSCNFSTTVDSCFDDDDILRKSNDR